MSPETYVVHPLGLTFALLIARFALATVFLVAGVAKLFDLPGSRAAIAGFGLPKSLAAPLGVALPIIELLVAIALIPAASARWGALGALVLLGVFVAGIANVMLRGREAECHCFGQLHSSPVGWWTLGRNLVFALIAVLVVAGERGGPSASYIDWISTLSTAELLALFVGAIALGFLATGSWFMANLLRQHGRLLLRLDTLEATLAERGIISDPGSADGLAPGTPAPQFALPDLRGGSMSLDDLLAPGLPLMLVFGHPGCTPCVAMFPELGRWQKTHSAELTIAMISQGTADENRAAAAEHSIERVSLQPGREIGDAYEAYGTPSAVLISKEGTIASAVAQGAPAIRVLLSSAVASAQVDENRITTDNKNGSGIDAQEPWRNGAAASLSGFGAHAN